MARILCCWERGAALGHLSSLRPFIERAVAEDHEVTLASRELRNVPQVLGKMPVRLLQAPLGSAAALGKVPEIRSVGGLLRALYGDDDAIVGVLIRAWEDLFDLVDPDLVIYDHSPTALIASLGRTWSKWVTGSGFVIPRSDQDLFGLFPQKPGAATATEVPAEFDTAVCATINEALAKRGRGSISRLSDIWDQADHKWLITLPELDHFGERSDTTYYGIPDSNFAEPSRWPSRAGPKVVGYLAACKALHPLLELLNQLPINGLFYTRDLSAEEIGRYPNLTIQHTPLPLPALLQSADLMINMAGHISVAEAYLAGVPQFLLVRQEEQRLIAWRVLEIQAGVATSASSTELKRPLQRAFALMSRGISRVDPHRAEEMRGARLTREIDTAFRDWSMRAAGSRGG